MTQRGIFKNTGTAISRKAGKRKCKPIKEYTPGNLLPRSSSTRSRYLESRHNGMIAIVSTANIVRLSQRWFRTYVLPDISFGASPRSMSATPHPSESIGVCRKIIVYIGRNSHRKAALRKQKDAGVPGFDKAVVPQNWLRKRSLDTRPPVLVPIRDVAIYIDGIPIKHRIRKEIAWQLIISKACVHTKFISSPGEYLFTKSLSGFYFQMVAILPSAKV